MNINDINSYSQEGIFEIALDDNGNIIKASHECSWEGYNFVDFDPLIVQIVVDEVNNNQDQVTVQELNKFFYPLPWSFSTSNSDSIVDANSHVVKSIHLSVSGNSQRIMSKRR